MKLAIAEQLDSSGIFRLPVKILPYLSSLALEPKVYSIADWGLFHF